MDTVATCSPEGAHQGIVCHTKAVCHRFLAASTVDGRCGETPLFMRVVTTVTGCHRIQVGWQGGERPDGPARGGRGYRSRSGLSPFLLLLLSRPQASRRAHARRALCCGVITNLVSAVRQFGRMVDPRDERHGHYRSWSSASAPISSMEVVTSQYSCGCSPCPASRSDPVTSGDIR